jgi:hypothetical protein
MRTLWLVLLLSPACTSGDGSTDADPADEIDAPLVGGDASADTRLTGDDGGAGLCEGGGLRVHPCCGGAPPPCYEVLDGGVCPPGTSLGTCALTGATGCVPPPCEPDPPYCAPPGSSCTTECGGFVDDDGVCNCLCA